MLATLAVIANRISLNLRSGIEEPQTERNSLLEEVSSLCKEYNFNFKQRKQTFSREQKLRQLGCKMRNDFSMNFDNGADNKIDTQPQGSSTSEINLFDHDYGE